MRQQAWWAMQDSKHSDASLPAAEPHVMPRGAAAGVAGSGREAAGAGAGARTTAAAGAAARRTGAPAGLRPMEPQVILPGAWLASTPLGATTVAGAAASTGAAAGAAVAGAGSARAAAGA